MYIPVIQFNIDSKQSTIIGKIFNKTTQTLLLNISLKLLLLKQIYIGTYHPNQKKKKKNIILKNALKGAFGFNIVS